MLLFLIHETMVHRLVVSIIRSKAAAVPEGDGCKKNRESTDPQQNSFSCVSNHAPLALSHLFIMPHFLFLPNEPSSLSLSPLS